MYSYKVILIFLHHVYLKGFIHIFLLAHTKLTRISSLNGWLQFFIIFSSIKFDDLALSVWFFQDSVNDGSVEFHVHVWFAWILNLRIDCVSSVIWIILLVCFSSFLLGHILILWIFELGWMIINEKPYHCSTGLGWLTLPLLLWNSN